MKRIVKNRNMDDNGGQHEVSHAVLKKKYIQFFTHNLGNGKKQDSYWDCDTVITRV